MLSCRDTNGFSAPYTHCYMRDPVAVTIYKCTFLGFAICSPKYPVHYHMLLLVAGWNSAHPQM